MASKTDKLKEFHATAKSKLKNPARAHALADAAVLYVCLMEVAKGLLIFGSFASFIVVALLFAWMES